MALSANEVPFSLHRQRAEYRGSVCSVAARKRGQLETCRSAATPKCKKMGTRFAETTAGGELKSSRSAASPKGRKLGFAWLQRRRAGNSGRPLRCSAKGRGLVSGRSAASPNGRKMRLCFAAPQKGRVSGSGWSVETQNRVELGRSAVALEGTQMGNCFAETHRGGNLGSSRSAVSQVLTQKFSTATCTASTCASFCITLF